MRKSKVRVFSRYFGMHAAPGLSVIVCGSEIENVTGAYRRGHVNTMLATLQKET